MTLIAAIHVAKKHLGLDDDTYRAKLRNITGKTSVKDMTEVERERVLTVLRNDGFKPAPTVRRSGGQPALTGKYAKKLQSLWIAAWNLGIVANRDDAALVAFVQRQTGIDHTRFLRYAEDAAKVIEALKSWIAREANVDWRETKLTPDHARPFGFKITRAQFRIMNPDGTDNDFFKVVCDLLWEDEAKQPNDREWIIVMNAFGERIRAARKDKA